jgi:hypothetical protein
MTPRSRASLLAALWAATASSTAPARAESFWTDTEESFLRTPTVLVQTGLDAAGSHLADLEANPVRARDLDRALGNRQIRVQLAAQANELTTKVNAFVKKTKISLLSIGLQVVETGISAPVRIYEGDMAGAAAEVLNEGTKTALVSGLTTWAAAKAGALAGTTFGPVGMVVGGAVAAASTAIVAAGGYDYLLGDAFQRGADYLTERTKESYLEEARQNRREHLERQEALRREKEQLIEEARRNRAAHLERQAQAAAPDDARPVIPADCALHLTAWNPAHPEYKVEIVFQIQDNEIAGRMLTPAQLGTGVRNHRQELTFTGRLKDNEIHGRWKGVTTWETVGEGRPMGTYYSQSTTDLVLTLGVDGSFRGTSTGSGTMSITWQNKRDGYPQDSNSSWGPHPDTLTGRWKFGGK